MWLKSSKVLTFAGLCLREMSLAKRSKTVSDTYRLPNRLIHCIEKFAKPLGFMFSSSPYRVADLENSFSRTTSEFQGIGDEESINVA